IDGQWQAQVIDSDGDVGQFSAIAADGLGNIHISYFDATNSVLKYALNTGAQTWTRTTVDSTTKVGTWTALVLDQDGNPCISYYDETSRILRYAFADLGLSTAHRSKSIIAHHRSGQTFITWKEMADLQEEHYRIYRSNTPIDAENLPKAQFLIQVGKNSSIIWSNYSIGGPAWEPRLTERMVFDNGAAPLRQGVGALVWTLAAEDFGGAASGTGYYAVTLTKKGGSETFLPGYTTGPIEEAVGAPDPVEISASTSSQPGPGGHYYLQYMDLRHWNPTFHAPNSTYDYYGLDPADPAVADALAYTYDYYLFEPTAELCGGTVPDTLPVMIFLHGARGNRYGVIKNYPYPYCAYGLYPIDQGDTWWFGFTRSHDYRSNSDFDRSDVVENFTEQRVLRMIADLIRKPPGPAAVDQQRIYLFGHSMGGTGSLAFAERYPNLFAAIYSGQPVTWFRATEGITERWPDLSAQRWGPQALNLPIASSATNGWAKQLEKYNGTGVFDWQNLPPLLIRRHLPCASLVRWSPLASITARLMIQFSFNLRPNRFTRSWLRVRTPGPAPSPKILTIGRFLATPCPILPK
ncbi:MAG: alpha/beta fold hydrolase, partial [Anaerolineaceae bacterium]|nr:alpha/beta fold hydrolase [Anaerolineaceae bacterium]